MTVLVIGSSGQLGSCLKEESVNYPEFTFLFKNSTELDITNQKSIQKTFNENSIQYCINCAAYTAVDKAETEREAAFSVNAEAVHYLAQVCNAQGAVLIHISTDFVFDGNKSTPYTELDTPNPLTVYGASKLKGESYIAAILKSYFIIRTSWLYSEFGSNFLKTMLRLSETKSEINVVDDQIGSPTYARDLAQTLLQIIDSKNQNFGLYHYSNKGETSWYDFAKAILDIINSPIKVSPISTSGYPTPAKRPNYSVLDKTKIIETFDLKIPLWQDSLQRALSNLSK